MQIYKITNMVNGKIYIGKNSTSRSDYMGSGVILNEAKLKYGIKNFRKDIVEDNIEDVKTLNDREIYWINYYNSQDRSIGYNRTEGGDGNNGKWNGDSLTEDHKANIGKAMKGREITWKEKLSEARKNSDSVKDLYKNEEWRSKISNSLKDIKKTEEHIKNVKNSMLNSDKLKESRSSNEFKEKCSMWQRGKKRDDEYMKKWLETKKINTAKRAEIDKKRVLNILSKHDWNIKEAAIELKCHLQTLKSKIKKYNLINER
jgi:hypothetical protein